MTPPARSGHGHLFCQCLVFAHLNAHSCLGGGFGVWGIVSCTEVCVGIRMSHVHATVLSKPQ